MSADLSPAPALVKLSHVKTNSMGTFDHSEGNNRSYNLPVKQYQANYNAPTLGDILRGADTVTSITINPSLLHKLSDSGIQVSDSPGTTALNLQRESPLGVQVSPTSYNTLLSSTGNERPQNNKSASSTSVKSKASIIDETESISETMKLKGNKYQIKDSSIKDKNNNGNRKGTSNFIVDNSRSIEDKGRRSRSRKRCRSAMGRNKGGQNVVDRLYQVPQSSGSKTSSTKSDFEPKLKAQNINRGLIQANGQGFGAMQISLCKPITILNNRPEKREIKSELPRRTCERVGTAMTSKSSNQSKSNEVIKDGVVLPQMTNSSLVNSVAQVEVRKTNNFFSPLTQKLPVHGSTSRNHNHYDTSNKVTKIYLSDKHSGTVKDCGFDIPCAPPATPTPEQLKKVEYIPSLNDIRSQRAVKLKLQVLEKEAQKKQEKQQLERERQEKQNRKTMEKDFKHQQRLEIYALNKVMTELENSRFKEFCAKKGIKTS